VFSATGTTARAAKLCTLTSSLSPTWQLDISGTAKRSDFTETPLHNVNFIEDYTGIVQPGAFIAQGLQFVQNPVTHDYGFGIDTEKTVNFHGQHTLSMGWGFSTPFINWTSTIRAANSPSRAPIFLGLTLPPSPATRRS
jgi:hypothetical protein